MSAQEQNTPSDEARSLILDELEATGILTLLDIEVLMGWQSRAQAAKQLNISYTAYKLRLQRKVAKLSTNTKLLEKIHSIMNKMNLDD